MVSRWSGRIYSKKLNALTKFLKEVVSGVLGQDALGNEGCPHMVSRWSGSIYSRKLNALTKCLKEEVSLKIKFFLFFFSIHVFLGMAFPGGAWPSKVGANAHYPLLF
ncbi:uncharacterized protein TM35_000041080 [Trypanosoma theileri]|uniref:Uncharacterized protein n=1 Tax=Trypanosoma theileri TaxID=67003 RepID=A0A1X0P4M3_9TRYP|nr:uncharacterized protein TM35_000041080 [Trypanosoma theileri]ORC91894.1 hypothetical protein TM35_000041080 [Trypanosoma theileri]